MPCGGCILLTDSSQAAAYNQDVNRAPSRGFILSDLLPLFPLELVLLPGVPVPLHIFEPRYKEMIKECLDQKTVFGIVRSKDDKDEGFATIGCTAELLNVLKTYPDGRMNIL